MPTIYIYGQRGCPYTERAVDLATIYNDSFSFQLYYPTPAQAREIMEFSGHYTYPICFYGKQLVGGSDALAEMLQDETTSSLPTASPT